MKGAYLNEKAAVYPRRKRRKLSLMYTYTNRSKRNFRAAIIVSLYSLPCDPPCPVCLSGMRSPSILGTQMV